MRKFNFKLAGYLFAVSVFFFYSRAVAFDPLTNADWRIKQYRTREVALRLEDENGSRLKESKVKVKMLNHQFLFGCNLFRFGDFPTETENQRYLTLWAGIFNYATIPFYFKAEKKSEEGEYLRNRETVNWCQDHGVTVKGHPLIWHSPAGNPKWLTGDVSEVEWAHQERIKRLVSEFSSEIKYWDLLNEPTVAWRYDTPVAKWENKIGPVKVFQKALKWAKAADRDAFYLVNDFNIDANSNLSSFVGNPERVIEFSQDPVKHYPVSYKKFVEAVIREGAKPDAVGIQSHMHRGNWPLWELWQLCDTYAQLRVPVHFTETTIVSGDEKEHISYSEPKENIPWPTTPGGEQRQADYLAKYYTLLFSHPAVQAITWWDFSDQGAWLNAPAGLVRKDLSPKPAYDTLRKLVREKWWTNLENRTDEEGKVRFRGFCGDYQISFADRPETLDFQINCRKKDGQEIKLRIPLEEKPKKKRRH